MTILIRMADREGKIFCHYLCPKKKYWDPLYGNELKQEFKQFLEDCSAPIWLEDHVRGAFCKIIFEFKDTKELAMFKMKYGHFYDYMELPSSPDYDK